MTGPQVKTVYTVAATLVAAFGVFAVFPLPVASAHEASPSAFSQDTAPANVAPKPTLQVSTRADSLYRAARTAMVKGDPVTSIRLFNQLARRYPKSPHATSALYFRGFLLYRQYKPGQPANTLREALADLRKLEQNYPNAPQVADARSLQNRICGELGQLGDSACRKQIVISALPSKIPTGGVMTFDSISIEGMKSTGTITFNVGPGIVIERDTTCHNDKELDSYVAALNGLWKVDSTKAIQAASTVLNKRERCLVRLREQTLLMVMQRPTPVLGMTPVIFEVARNDPDSNVKRLATLWLLSQEWDSQTAQLLHSIFGQTFRVKTTAKAKESADGKRE